jgi:hypothetical protein
MSKFAGHKYQWTMPFTSVRHHWELRGPRGGIHFHVSIQNDSKYDPSCGLEFHHCFDPTGGKTAPHHVNCPVTGGQCWHDGTSLYASEYVWPLVEHYLRDGDHPAVFRILEREYEKHFERGDDE